MCIVGCYSPYMKVWVQQMNPESPARCNIGTAEHARFQISAACLSVLELICFIVRALTQGTRVRKGLRDTVIVEASRIPIDHFAGLLR